VNRHRKFLIEQRKSLWGLSPSQRRIHLLGLYYNAFTEILDEKDLNHYMFKIISVLNGDTGDAKDKYKIIDDQRKIFEHELRRLKKLCKSRHVPAAIKLLLGEEYLSSLNGIKSRSLLPGYGSCYNDLNDERAAIDREVRDLLEPIANESSIQSTIPFNSLFSIISTPFYSISLKSLILKAYPPNHNDMKILHAEVEFPSALTKTPYSFLMKLKRIDILKDYLVLADYFEIGKKMKNFEEPKRKLPYYSEDIIKVIIESRHPKNKVTKNLVKDCLRQIFDPESK
jgi:hypothetical protein